MQALIIAVQSLVTVGQAQTIVIALNALITADRHRQRKINLSLQTKKFEEIVAVEVNFPCLTVLPVSVMVMVLTTAAQSGAFVDLELIIVTVQLAKTSVQRVKD